MFLLSRPPRLCLLLYEDFDDLDINQTSRFFNSLLHTVRIYSFFLRNKTIIYTIGHRLVLGEKHQNMALRFYGLISLVECLSFMHSILFEFSYLIDTLHFLQKSIDFIITGMVQCLEHIKCASGKQKDLWQNNTHNKKC